MAIEPEGQGTSTPGQDPKPLGELAGKATVVEKEETVAKEKEPGTPSIKDTPEFQAYMASEEFTRMVEGKAKPLADSIAAKSAQTYQKNQEELRKENERLKGELGVKQEAKLQAQLADLPKNLLESGEANEQEVINLEKAIQQTNAVRRDTNKRMEYVNYWMPKAKRAEEMAAATSTLEDTLGKDGIAGITISDLNELADEFKDCGAGNDREYKLAARAVAVHVKSKFGKKQEVPATKTEDEGANAPDTIISTGKTGVRTFTRNQIDRMSPEEYKKNYDLIHQAQLAEKIK